MKLKLFPITMLCGLAAAWSKNSEPKGHEFLRAKPWDVRSPCPGLNVLANHGWLPRSGRDIDIEDIRFATGGVFNYASDVFDGAVQAVFSANLSTTKNYTSTFNLNDLASPAAHNTVEFDGSLSRNDFLLGDSLHFDPAIWNTVAAHLGLRHDGRYSKDRYVTVETAAKARAARVKDDMKANPKFDASQAQMNGSPGTTGLYLTTLWDDNAKAAPKAWVKTFFEEERIPYYEGFKKPVKVKTSQILADMVAAVRAVPV